MTTLLSAPHLAKTNISNLEPLEMSQKIASNSPKQTTEVYQHSGADSKSFATQSPSNLFAPPKLTEPTHVHFDEIKFIKIMDEIQMTGDSLIDSFSKSISLGSEKIKKLSLENMEKLKEAAEKAQEGTFWSFLQQVGECILAAISTVLGITLVSTGAGSIIGGAMIASGIITLVNFIMKDTGSWNYISKQLSDDRKRQEELTRYLPLATSIVSSVLGLASTGAAALFTNMNAVQQGLVIAQAALGLYQGGVTVAKSVNDADATWKESDLTQLQSDKDLQKFRFQEDSQLLNQIIKILRSSQEAAEQVIDLAAQALRRTVLQV
ncbi:MAG: hypothetical protein FJZ57_02745 [Chlamydiae bacterium]|nr:hypothetical protein [Chlamydiota bacterium]